MNDIAKLDIEVDTSGVIEAAKHMERLANAAERVSAALQELNGKPHGGITFECVGVICHLEVKSCH